MTTIAKTLPRLRRPVLMRVAVRAAHTADTAVAHGRHG